MNVLFDAALVVISGCTALYCYMLGRRLRAFHNLRKGIGHAVTDLTRSVKDVEAKALNLNRSSSLAVSELGVMLSKVDGYETKVDLILETMDQQARETWKEHHGRLANVKADTDEALDELTSRMEEAKSLALLLNKQISAMAQVADRQTQLINALKDKEMPQPDEVKAADSSAEQPADDLTQADALNASQHLGAGRQWANAAVSDQDAEEQKARRIAEAVERLSRRKKTADGDTTFENPFRRGASA